MKIPYANAFLLPRFLQIAGVIDRWKAERLMDRLEEIGRYGKKIVQFARHCPDERLLDFLPLAQRFFSPVLGKR